ncbi:glucose-6-phosphate isomerase family protein [Enterococcus silesiacus]|nr:glucose-6-phosphate isomerase family protein [Enterococcus silesiacus]
MREKIIHFNPIIPKLEGVAVKSSQTRLESYVDHYLHGNQEPDLTKIIYEVEYHDNGLVEGCKGGLFLGISHVMPGTVGNEFYMTKGHIHREKDTGEYYWGMKGKGLLLIVFKDNTYKLEDVTEGSIHYIPGNTSHRLINTGTEKLSVGACWLSESGHDYVNCHFPVRVFKKGEKTIEVSHCTT